MKITKIIFSLLLIAVVISYGCKKEVSPVIIYDAGDQEFGWATGMKEGHQWNASGYWRYHTNDSTYWGINFVTYTSYGAQREHFALNEIPFSKGTFSIKGGINNLGDGFIGGDFGFFADDGDALIGYMQPNENENGFLEITEIDFSTRTIKGFFEIYFISEDESLKIEIKDGEFEVRLYEE
ncbi:MAG TPA: hypothetical protein ENK75_00795 [Saprospiraceae bacterium]|nr:hypothetical protein [Saprospiraceae bacterium]